MISNDQSHRVRFGPYEADLRTHELWKHGTRLKLSGQPFQILEVMLKRPGELITRDELREKLWPEDTFVDFGHGLNAAINKLRDALSDSADDPRYVETLPRRGYRFIGTVERAAPEPVRIKSEPIFPDAIPLRPLSSLQPKAVSARVEPPGFEGIAPDETGSWRRVALTSVLLVIVLGLMMTFVEQRITGQPKRFDENAKLKPISLNDSSIVQLGVGPAAGKQRAIETGAGRNESPQLSPDGQRMAFMSDRSGGSEIWVSGADGSNPVQLTDLGSTGSPRWSPDSKTIAFDGRVQDGHGAIYTVPLTGGLAKPLLREEHEDLVPNFSRDGRWIYYASDASGTWQLWKTPTDGGAPQRITSHGGFFAQEGPDGYLYYADTNMPNPQIWRTPIQGGDQTQIFPMIVPRDWASWAVAPDGIYFIEDSQSGAVLNFYDFAHHDIRSVGLLSKPSFWLSISPDAKWLLMDQSQ